MDKNQIFNESCKSKKKKKKSRSECYVHNKAWLAAIHTIKKTYKYTSKSPYLVWIGWDSGTTELLDVLSSNTGLSIEYIGGGDFLIFIFEKLRMTELVRKHFFLTRFWANWNNKILIDWIYNKV